jgi:hypothetical protein
MNDHHNVKRGSLIWRKIFKNTSISRIPIVKPINASKYSYAIDNPNINKSMTVEYDSELEIDQLIPIVISKLRKNGFEVNIGSVRCGEWAWRLRNNDGEIEYHGKSPKGECLYLEFIEIENLVNVNAGIAD